MAMVGINMYKIFFIRIYYTLMKRVTAQTPLIALLKFHYA